MAKRIVSFSLSHRNTHPSNESTLEDNQTTGFNNFPYLELGVIVGLGFTAVLASGSQINQCKAHVDTFLRCRGCYFFDKIPEISEAVAQVILLGATSFKKLGYPRYFDEFLWAICLVTSDFYSLPKEIKKAIDDMLHQVFEIPLH